jgi:hypothetical protein
MRHTDRVNYTHCIGCDGTGLDQRDGFTSCVHCIGQGGLYIEPKPMESTMIKPPERLTWAVNGLGQRTICHQNLKEFPYGIACPIRPEYFWELIDILEAQQTP